jgi:hypothetical protein
VGAKSGDAVVIRNQEEKQGPFGLPMGVWEGGGEVIWAEECDMARGDADARGMLDPRHVGSSLPFRDKEEGTGGLLRCLGGGYCPTDGFSQSTNLEIWVDKGAACPGGRVGIVDGPKEGVMRMCRVVVTAEEGDIQG